MQARLDAAAAFIGPFGDLLETGNQFEADIMTTDIWARKGLTPYANSGNWPVTILCFLVLGIFWVRSRAGI